MPAASETIRQASIAARRVQIHVKHAIDILLHTTKGRAVNNLGIYHDPAHHVSELREARGAIDAALAELTSASWPSDADYAQRPDRS